MPKRKVVSDEEIAAAIVESKTRKEAAQKLGVNPRTIYTRSLDSSTAALIESMRAERLRERLRALDDVQTAAIRCIADIIGNPELSAETRLKAAIAALETGKAARAELREIDEKTLEKAGRAALEFIIN